MIKIYSYKTLGRADHGWLSTHYHFSFADYYNPDRMGFGALRVINDDTIQPRTGFPTHPHRNMEIITYVTQGAISHKDSQGNQGRTEAGDVQVMTAGSGIFPSEYNNESIETRLFQIWITPHTPNLKPVWKSHQFPEHQSNTLSLLVSGDGTAPLMINQDARIFAGNLSPDKPINHPLQGNAYLVLVEGALRLDEQLLSQGDGAEITDTNMLNIQAVSHVKLLLIEV